MDALNFQQQPDFLAWCCTSCNSVKCSFNIDCDRQSIKKTVGIFKVSESLYSKKYLSKWFWVESKKRKLIKSGIFSPKRFLFVCLAHKKKQSRNAVGKSVLYFDRHTIKHFSSILEFFDSTCQLTIIFLTANGPILIYFSHILNEHSYLDWCRFKTYEL